MRFVTMSAESLRLAGYQVNPAEGVPGLWDVVGLASDVTTGQLHDLADRHGKIATPWLANIVNLNPGS